jgi:S-DNA-T family DNA segregation ATPase FtsK/SpoIIIE
MGRRKKKKLAWSQVRDLDLNGSSLNLSPQTKRWIWLIAISTAGVLLLFSFTGLAGIFGAYVDSILRILFGVSRWVIPILFFVLAYFLLRSATYGVRTITIIGTLLFILSFNGLVHVLLYSDEMRLSAQEGLGGGYSGLIIGYPVLSFMGFWAGLVVLLALTVVGLVLLFETYFSALISRIKEQQEDEDESEEEEEPRNKVFSLKEKLSSWWMERKLIKLRKERETIGRDDSEEYSHDDQQQQEDEEESLKKEVLKSNLIDEGEDKENQDVETEDNEEARALSANVKKFKRSKIDIPLSLLDGKTTTPNGGDLKANKVVIQKTLQNFGIQVEMGEAQVGPTVTQYTLKPAEGVKLSRITGLSDNLALALAAHPIRIEAPIPGKSLIGVEVPNQATSIVPLNSILSSTDFTNRTSNLMLALGKDVMGKPWMYPLDKMPHMLVAGATGSGKSVCINTIILSLLYQNGPGDLKFIMVDPKRVELPGYNGIPHLLTPVITDVKKTVNALRWAVREMERRFDVLSAARHRNIASYNSDAGNERMPYIVVIIDELADLMATAGQEVEALIVRLSQMSRAVGIHLILATQRPSVDVITGVIKANITARIAFSVASLVDSRTILDNSGAEKLLGRGDMLYISAEISKPKRLQGAYASDDEIRRVIDYLKDQEEPEYLDEIVEKQAPAMGEGGGAGSDDDEDGDPLLGEAKQVIVRAGKASASLLQRRLRIGYARAARILDLLEAQGVISPGDGAKPRDVLITIADNDIIPDINDEMEEDSDEDTEPDFIDKDISKY